MLGLGWALLALRVLGEAPGGVEAALAREGAEAPGRAPGPDVPSLAVAALALTEDDRLGAMRL
jgi:hypothetical protein